MLGSDLMAYIFSVTRWPAHYVDVREMYEHELIPFVMDLEVEDRYIRVRHTPTGTSWDLRISRCVDPSEQDAYIKRLVNSHILGKRYDDILVLRVSNRSLLHILDDEQARIVYAHAGAYEVQANRDETEVTLAQAAHPLEADEVIKTAVTYQISSEGEFKKKMLSIRDFPWMDDIFDDHDLYETPLNEKWRDRVTYLKHKGGYSGSHIFLQPDSCIFIKLAGVWVKLEKDWFVRYLDSFPQEVKDEYNLYLSIQLG